MDNSKATNEQVVALYEKAISNLHAKNLIIYLAFADFEEQQMRTQNAQEIYQKFLAQEDIDPSLVCYAFLPCFTLRHGMSHLDYEVKIGHFAAF